MNAVVIGSIFAPKAACACSIRFVASRASCVLAVSVLYSAAAAEYSVFKVAVIRLARSCSELHFASCSLNFSSEMPAQFNASASGPVTAPTFAVSFAASVSPSIGKLSPNLAVTPAAIVDHFDKSSVLSVSSAKWFTASTVRSLSPRIL